MHHVFIYYTCACSIDGWPNKKRASHSQTCRVLAHRQRPHPIARVCKNTHAHPFTYPDLTSIYNYIYIFQSYMTCASAMHTSGRAHAHAPDGNGHIVGARNGMHVCIRGGAAACTPIPISHTSTYLPICICMMHTYMCTYIYIHAYIPSFVRAAIPTHVGTRACACPHVGAHTRARASAAPPRTTARVASTTRRARPARGGAPARAEKGGAYIVQRGDRGGVPRADVRVERRRLLEHLRAEPSAVHADGERGHVSARVRGRPIAYEHARAHGRSTWARVCGGPPSAIRSSG
jgi:hypothetical protein